MLSDGTLRGLKPQASLYKVADRDGLYVVVTPRGTVSFRMDYRLNGRRETLTIGRYGSKDGISLLMARERCMEARKAIALGISPAQEKQREKSRLAEAQTFGEYTKRWLGEHRMADSTKTWCTAAGAMTALTVRFWRTWQTTARPACRPWPGPGPGTPSRSDDHLALRRAPTPLSWIG